MVFLRLPWHPGVAWAVPRARRNGPQPRRRASDPLDRARLAAVLQVARAVGTTLDLRELLPLVMDQVTAVMKADRSTLFLKDDETGELWSTVAQRSRPATRRSTPSTARPSTDAP